MVVPSRLGLVAIVMSAVATFGLFCCQGDADSSTRDVANESNDYLTSLEPTIHASGKFVDTRYEYVDAIGKGIRIENSLPKGGMTYSNQNGDSYIYAVFWTRITNQSADPLKISIASPVDSVGLRSSPDNYFRLFLTNSKMSSSKEPLVNYGLDTEILDSILYRAPKWQVTIEPEGSAAFHVIALFSRGVKGVVRAGMYLEGQALFYEVNGNKTWCGRMNFAEMEQK